MTETETLQKTAREAADWFETVARHPDGEETYTRTKDGRPDWVLDLVRDAHGDMFPDDWRYATISRALDWICDAIVDDADLDDQCGEFADSAVDVYNAGRLQWLGSHLERAGYCDEAQSEMGAADSIMDAIGMGQYAEASEVYWAVLGSLRKRAEDMEAAAAESEA